MEVQLDEQENTQKKAAEEKKKSAVVTADNSGFRISSPNKAFQLRIGGIVGYDYAWFRQDDELRRAVGDEQDGVGFRFARIRLLGTVWDNVSFQGEYDFAGENAQDSPRFRDTFISLNEIPYGGDRGFELWLGHFREPFSLEELTSVTNRTFVERSLANVFAPSRNAGVLITDALLGEPRQERLQWAIGAFKETDDWPSSNDSDEDQGYQITARVSGLPYYARDGRRLVHAGAAYSRRNPDGARLAYGLRPETRLSLFRYADADNLPAGFRLRDARADDVDLFGVELASLVGPFSLQGEYVHSAVNTTFGGDLDFRGHYAQATCTLTGEHRAYDHARGRFKNPVPEHPARWRGDNKAWGAWEAAVRYASVDLDDGPVRGGQHDSLTLGLNWYLNTNARVTWNYIRNYIDHDLYDGSFDVFQTRFQVEF